MPGEIDPSALSRADSAPQNGSATPTSKPLTLSTSASKSTSKTAPSAPRVDPEPIYTNLKAVIGDNWAEYKDAVSCYLLGTLNATELARRIDPFLSIPPPAASSPISVSHLHNQLLFAIHINTSREPPDQPIASWVSAHDKPTATPKPLSGDAAEARLKQEVMQLPPRARHRLKNIADEPAQPIREDISGLRQEKRPPPPTSAASAAPAAAAAAASASQNAGDATPTAATGLNKDADIKKRFTQPLISETRDLPASLNVLADRLLPLAYEAGLNGSTAAGVLGCADYLTIAMENFLKEEINTILTRTRTDAPVSTPVPGLDAAGTGGAAAAQAGATAINDPSLNGGSVNGIPMGLGGGGNANGLAGAASGILGGQDGVLTEKYKRKLLQEEAAAHRGEIKRSELGLLPVEREKLGKLGAAGTMGDLRMGWELGNNYLRIMVPWLQEKVLHVDDAWSGRLATDQDSRPDHINGNRDAGEPMDGLMLTNGVNGHDTDAMDIDGVGDAWAWEGATRPERDALAGLLDGCLAVGR